MIVLKRMNKQVKEGHTYYPDGGVVSAIHTSEASFSDNNVHYTDIIELEFEFEEDDTRRKSAFVKYSDIAKDNHFNSSITDWINSISNGDSELQSLKDSSDDIILGCFLRGILLDKNIEGEYDYTEYGNIQDTWFHDVGWAVKEKDQLSEPAVYLWIEIFEPILNYDTKSFLDSLTYDSFCKYVQKGIDNYMDIEITSTATEEDLQKLV